MNPILPADPQPPVGDPNPPGTVQPGVSWVEFTDASGNRHVIALIVFPVPGGGIIRLLIELIFPADGGTPIVILDQLVGTSDLLALRENVAAVADVVLALIMEQVSGLDPRLLHWLVHHGAFSTADGTLGDAFHEIALGFDGQHYHLIGVRMLAQPEADGLAAALDLPPVDQALDQLGVH